MQGKVGCLVGLYSVLQGWSGAVFAVGTGGVQVLRLHKVL